MRLRRNGNKPGRFRVKFKNSLFPANLHFGEGILGEIAGEIRLHGDNALIVPAKDSMKRLGFLDKLIETLEYGRIKTAVFEGAGQNPTSGEVDKGVKAALDNGSNVVVALGGGSAIDTAKGIAVGATHFEEGVSTIWDFVPVGGKSPQPVTAKTLPVVAVPSTSGTGSHVTPYFVITNPKTHEKPGVYSPHVVPKVSVVDIDIVSTMPKQLTAVTGFDALSHAMESFAAKGEHPISDLFALKSVELISKNLEEACSNGDNRSARANMALADTLAGLAISTSRSILPHSMAHSISGHYPGIQHGQAVACMTIPVMGFNLGANDLNAVTEKYSRIAEAFGRRGKNRKDLALKSVEAVLELQEKIGVRKTLADIGVDRIKISAMADDAFRVMRSGIERNPRAAEKSDLVKICEEAFEG